MYILRYERLKAITLRLRLPVQKIDYFNYTGNSPSSDKWNNCDDKIPFKNFTDWLVYLFI